MQSIHSLERYMVVMSPDELSLFEQIILHHPHFRPNFPPSTILRWETDLQAHALHINSAISQALL